MTAPLLRTLDLLGDQWILLILQSIFLRVRRYDDIQRRLGISPTALSGRLSDAVEAGVLVRVPYQSSNRTRHEYRLTSRGLDLWQLLTAIWTWERDWMSPRGLPDLLHRPCGEVTSAPLGCADCGQPVRLTEVAFQQRQPLMLTGQAQRRFRRTDSSRFAADPLLFFPTTMEMLGDRWSVGLLSVAFFGGRHFSEFERALGIAPSVLSGRLARLVELGIMRTTIGTTRTDARAYHLTAKGRAFFPTLVFIADWTLTQHPAIEPTVLITHTPCGSTLAPCLLCSSCGHVLTRTTVRIQPRD
ncbi:winged helix-turn-helix transcriptional regulator [Fodinicola acaciae]|uniref:winged helix-turn-helix transcriptional regulator n=1 Tax=Fodinicola acaciae TaxID=2681555 RepID=UPI0013D59AC5|nr:helix-turn-helix domain-containing protein [Fodinicola acaciae]